MGVKSSIKITSLSPSKIREIKKLFFVFNSNLAKEIKEQIMRGVSPVENQGKYRKYSDSYIKQIVAKRPSSLRNKFGKTKSPVSLKLSGEMLESLQVKKISDGITIQITDKKSEYHNEGNNNMPRRALLPKEGEEFSRLIQQKIRKALEKAINQVFRR